MHSNVLRWNLSKVVIMDSPARYIGIAALVLSFGFSGFSQATHSFYTTPGFVLLTFENTIKHEPIALNDSTYTNPFGESYTISKLRYYVSNIVIGGNQYMTAEKNSYHLIDEAQPGSKRFLIPVKPGKYESLTFLIGIDSLHNVSGAQTGAMDPLNDMFWTWHTGYVMAKMEGHSKSSLLANNVFEYHIGGFEGGNSVLKKLTLKFPMNESYNVAAGKTLEIIVEADINEWWHGKQNIRIAVTPTVTSPGLLAKNISDNYAKMFVVQQATQSIRISKPATHKPLKGNYRRHN